MCVISSNILLLSDRIKTGFCGFHFFFLDLKHGQNIQTCRKGANAVDEASQASNDTHGAGANAGAGVQEVGAKL